MQSSSGEADVEGAAAEPLGEQTYDPRMPPLPRNSDVADALEELADLSEVLGEQGFRVIAYRRAATRVRETAASIAELALAGRAKELPGIGATIEAKVVELTETGQMAALEKRRAEVPGEVTQFLRLPGLGPKTAARIWRELDVTTLDELRAAAEQQLGDKFNVEKFHDTVLAQGLLPPDLMKKAVLANLK